MTKYKNKKQKLHPEHVYRNIAFTILGAFIALFVVTIVYASSSARIIIKTREKPVKKEFMVAVKDVPVRKGYLAKRIEIEKEQEQEFKSSYIRTDEPNKAHGKVILINESKVDQPLVATTRLLSSSGILFRLKEAVIVPAQGQIEAEVYADKPGIEGEIAPDTFSIPGLAKYRQKEVYAKSESAMIEGTKFIYKITEEDIKGGLKAIEDKVGKEGKVDLAKNLADGEKLLGDEIFSKLIEKEVDAEVGEQKEKFKIKAKFKIFAFVVKEEDLFNFFEKKLKEELGAGMSLTYFDKKKTNYKIDRFDKENQLITLSVHAEGKVRLLANSKLFTPRLFMGLTPKEVEQKLRDIDAVDDVQVKLWPLWTRRVPNIESRIFIILQDK